MQVQLKIRSMRPRDAGDDDTVGIQLVAAVQRALRKGAAPPAAVTVRDERIDIFMADQIKSAQLPFDLFLAGLTRADAPGGDLRCAGVIGTMHHKANPELRQAVVYLEWSDCRWWLWRALIDADGVLREDTETVRRAEDGHTKPLRLGGWWSHGRRARLSARLNTHRANPVH